MSDFSTWIISGHTYGELLALHEQQQSERPWLAFFCWRDPMRIQCGDIASTCRLEPVPIHEITVERLFFLAQSAAKEELLGGSLMTRIAWDGRAGTMPDGWQGVVRRSYRDARSPGVECNTLAGLQLFTLSRFRRQGLSGRFIDEMLRHGQNLQMRYVFLPALIPVQFRREYAELPFHEVAKLTRDDGLPIDHWVRLHVRKGGVVLGYCAKSHRFALGLDDFHEHITSDRITQTGYHVVRLDKDATFGLDMKNTWQRVYADVENDVVSFNWGCAMVRYDLRSPGVSLHGAES